MSKVKYCQNEVDFTNGVRCKKPCTLCLKMNGEYYNLKDEYKHEDDE